MATPYEPPEWGRDGRNAFGLSLDVVRNGVLLESLALPLDPAKSFVVAGRMEPLCDLVLQHPSLSRVHAALQFDAHGALFVKDLKSTYGTFVNKKRLPPLEFQRLHVGDLLVFGESTRKYAVCGPDELRPEEADMEKLRAKIQARKEAEKKREEREAAGATWGFREDAEEEDDSDASDDDGDQKKKRRSRDDESDLPEYLRGIKEHGRTAYESSVKQSDISEKDQKMFTQLQNKIAKMENLETEKARILAKQNNLQGLTEGQEKTLERNNARIESLMKEIEDLEAKIHDRTAQREKSRSINSAKNSKGRSQGGSSSMYNYDSDEDDFYDRTSANLKKHADRKQQHEQALKGKMTASTKKTNAKTEVLTTEIITKKIEILEKDLKDLNAEYTRVQADDDGAKAQGEEEADALEAFMKSTAKELHMKELARLQNRRQEVEAELKKQRQLLAIALPALSHEQPVTSKQCEESKPGEGSPHADLLTDHKPTPLPAQLPTNLIDRDEGAETAQVKSPPRQTQEKNERRTKHETPNSEQSKPHDETEPAKPKKRRLLGPTLPPPAVTAARSSDASELEGGDRVWVPPANQTGDGRTKLNDKYGY